MGLGHFMALFGGAGSQVQNIAKFFFSRFIQAATASIPLDKTLYIHDNIFMTQFLTGASVVLPEGEHL